MLGITCLLIKRIFISSFTAALLNWAPRIPFMCRVMILEALTTALDFDLRTDGFRLLIDAGLLKFISGRY